MALSTKDKKLIIADFQTGKYSQRDLAKKYNVSNGTVANITKGIERKNEHLVDAQVSLLTAKAYLSDIELSAIMSTAQNEVFNNGLVTNASQLNLVRMTQHLQDNTKLEKINVGDGVQNFEPVGLGSGDYKNIQDAIHKAGQSLKVIDQFAPKVEINNANNQQTNIDNTIQVAWK